MVVVAVRCRHVSPTHAWLEIVLAHETLDLLVIDRKALLAEGCLDAPPTVAFELVADGAHRFDDGSVIDRICRCVVVGRARDPHQPASFGDGDAFGPAIADVGPLLAGGAFR